MLMETAGCLATRIEDLKQPCKVEPVLLESSGGYIHQWFQAPIRLRTWHGRSNHRKWTQTTGVRYMAIVSCNPQIIWLNSWQRQVMVPLS